MALAWLMWVGTHPVAVVIVAVALLRPLWFLLLSALWTVGYRLWRRRRTDGTAGETGFLEGMAAELQAGASLRGALEAAAMRAPGLPLHLAVRRARAGRPAAEVAEALGPALPTNGRLVAAAFRLAAVTGARTASLFGALAVRSAEAGDLLREQRAATAQARLSAWVVGAAPLVLLALTSVLGGGFSSLLAAGPSGWVLGGAGLFLEALGATAVWLMMRRALV